MAVRLLAHEVTDLCLGKPALKSLPVTATVAEALEVLKSSEDSFVSVWKSCVHNRTLVRRGNSNLSSVAANDGNNTIKSDGCECVGKVSMVDVICYLCKHEKNLSSPSVALEAPVTVLLPKISGLVIHVEPDCSLLEAVDLMLQGAQNLVVPIRSRKFSTGKRKQPPVIRGPTTTIHDGREYCWLTQEDVIRFLLSSIGLFSPIPALSIEYLGIIRSDDSVMAVEYYSPASAAIDAISRSLTDQTAIAVVDGEGVLIGEISPFTLACCEETVAAAVATLSTGDLMAYIDCGGPPEDLVRVVTARLREKGLEGMLQHFTQFSSNLSSVSSSDEESPPTMMRPGRHSRSSSYSARMVRRAEAIVCHPRSSLVAVMIQAIAHRVNYIWVVEDDCSLVGIVTFSEILKVFRDHLEAMNW